MNERFGVCAVDLFHSYRVRLRQHDQNSLSRNTKTKRRYYMWCVHEVSGRFRPWFNYAWMLGSLGVLASDIILSLRLSRTIAPHGMAKAGELPVQGLNLDWDSVWLVSCPGCQPRCQRKTDRRTWFSVGLHRLSCLMELWRANQRWDRHLVMRCQCWEALLKTV